MPRSIQLRWIRAKSRNPHLGENYLNVFEPEGQATKQEDICREHRGYLMLKPPCQPQLVRRKNKQSCKCHFRFYYVQQASLRRQLSEEGDSPKINVLQDMLADGQGMDPLNAPIPRKGLQSLG